MPLSSVWGPSRRFGALARHLSRADPKCSIQRTPRGRSRGSAYGIFLLVLPDFPWYSVQDRGRTTSRFTKCDRRIRAVPGAWGCTEDRSSSFGLDFLSHFWYFGGRPVQLLNSACGKVARRFAHWRERRRPASTTHFRSTHPASPVSLFPFPRQWSADGQMRSLAGAGS